MIFVGVDGLGGPAGGIQKVIDGVLAATFVYPLCVDKAVEIGRRMLHEPGFQPEKEYVLESLMVTKENAAEMYLRPGDVVECEIEKIGTLSNPVISWEDAYGVPAPPLQRW